MAISAHGDGDELGVSFYCCDTMMIHKKGYFMLHHLATIQKTNLVNYNCHSQEDGNHFREIVVVVWGILHVICLC